MPSHLILHEKQKEIARSNARFKVIRAGRRGGKTLYEVENMSFRAVSSLETQQLLKGKDRRVLFIAPTQKQARAIVWEALKSRLSGIGDPRETSLEMRLPTTEGTQAVIYVGGWENRENYRGLSGVYHITFDETDSMQHFFSSWQEIFRPMLIDTGGTADFIGTPKKENPNLRRLEKEFAEKGEDFASFHFTTLDNPYIPRSEIEAAKRDMDPLTYKQEILAEYVENVGALFHYDALIDIFSNTITKDNEKYLIADIADDGTDKTIFSFWNGLEEYRREEFSRLNTERIIDKIREYAADDRIPYSHIAVDAIGVGAGVASSSLLDGIVGYKSSYGAIRTDESIVKLPNIHYRKDAPLTSDYKNLRAQCVFILADYVNNHKIASKVQGKHKEYIIEELSQYQDVTKGDSKRMPTPKEEVRELLGRSPDHSDCFIMRIYFEIRGKMLPHQSVSATRAIDRQNAIMAERERRAGESNTK